MCFFCKCTIKFVALTWKAVLLCISTCSPHSLSYACLQCALAYMSYAHVHPSLYLMKLVLSLNPELTDPSKSGQLAPGFPDSAFPRSQCVLFSCGFWGSDLWFSFLQGESFIHGAISLALIYICPLYKANYFHMLKIYYKNLLFTSCLFLVIQWSSKLQVQLFFRLIFFCSIMILVHGGCVQSHEQAKHRGAHMQCQLCRDRGRGSDVQDHSWINRDLEVALDQMRKKRGHEQNIKRYKQKHFIF